MKQFFRFLTVGVFNTLLGYCVIFGCMYLAKMSAEISNIIGYSVGLVASYVLNRTYTFKSQQKRHTEITRFLAAFGVAYTFNFGVLVILIHRMNIHEGVSQILAGCVYVVASYIMNKYYVFKVSSSSVETIQDCSSVRCDEPRGCTDVFLDKILIQRLITLAALLIISAFALKDVFHGDRFFRCLFTVLKSFKLYLT